MRELVHVRGVLFRAEGHLCKYWTNTASFLVSGRLPAFVTDAQQLIYESIADINYQIKLLQTDYWGFCTRREYGQQETFH